MFQNRNFESAFSNILDYTGWIELIFDTVDLCNFVINKFNPIFEVQGSGNRALHNIPF